MNLYLHLFYWVYSRQKKEYGDTYGVFSGSMSLTVLLTFIVVDIYILGSILGVVEKPIRALPECLIITLLIFGLNLLYFYRKKRFLVIAKRFEGLSVAYLKRLRVSLVIIMIVLVLFFFIGTSLAS